MKILKDFTEKFVAVYPEVPILDRDANTVPHLTQLEMNTGRVAVEKHTAEQVEAFRLADAVTDELHNACAIVIATPMHNWGMPSALKAWIDRIINTRNFYTKKETLHNVPITIIVASGGPYSADAGVPGNVHLDFLRPHLTHCLQQIGADDITFLNCDPTGPIIAGRMDEFDEKSGMSRARRQLAEMEMRVAK